MRYSSFLKRRPLQLTSCSRVVSPIGASVDLTALATRAPGFAVKGSGRRWCAIQHAKLFLLSALLALAAAAQNPPAATLPEAITVPAGFKIELLRSAGPDEGSWVALAVDEKGRLYISPQGNPPGADYKKESKWGGLWRATLGADGKIAQWERVPVPVGGAMGLLWAFDSLYVSGMGPDGQAIYRVRDSDGDDTLDSVSLFKKVPGGGGEHGAHAMVVGPDGKLYITHGNSTPLVEGIDPSSPFRNYAEDDLLPRIKDPVATFFDKLKVPYGHILRTDPDGKKWELFAAGLRNAYDIDFNADGELFTYDSDMEWDVGLPWYRPTRILHITAGAEFGFREGSAKWPEYYADSLPSVVDVGLGSPTGVKFGTRSNFPEKYRRVFFAMDWTFGRILAVDLKPKGSSYEGTWVEFVKGKGLPVTDLEFGKDGAMYFTTGGRGTQAGLYRVSWVGEKDSGTSTTSQGSEQQRKAASMQLELRRQSETLDENTAGSGVGYREELGWGLESRDRAVRFAGRLALERAPLALVRAYAFEEKDPRPSLTALLALARVGEKSDQEPLLRALTKWPLDSLDEPLKLLKLRVVEVTFARHGRPSDELVSLATEKLSKQYPASSFALNHELSQLLVWLTNPTIAGGSPNEKSQAAARETIEKTLALLEQSTVPEEQIWYAYCLRAAAPQAWTPAQRERFFAWFPKAMTFKGGNSAQKFIARIRDLALEGIPEGERPRFVAVAEPKAEAPKAAAASARTFTQNWTLADLAPDLDRVSRGRDFARGKEMYAAAQCASCHLFAGEGGNIGPDLSAVASRYNRHDLLEAILDPSKGISEQYAVFHVTQFDGKKEAAGMIVEETNDSLSVLVDPLRGTREMISKFQPPKRELLPVSPMPPGLLNTLTRDEILDLLAFLESDGNAKAAQFRQ